MDITKIRILFIIPEHYADASECSKHMHQAFDTCQHNAMNIDWVREEDYKTVDLKKTDFLVFQSFDGKCFDDVKDSKCTILGPWCLLTCITTGHPIPNFPWPIFNMAMADCCVACSHLPKNVKQELRYKIQSMGGQYTDTLVSKNTHLVTNSVKSEKYIKAAEAGLKLMLTTWVDAVWTASLNKSVHCNEDQFQSHRCLPFHNLTICCTGFTELPVREELESLVKKNGGIYMRQLHIGSTDILVCKEGTNSEKYKAARKNKRIKCVTFDWLTDSVEKGYALPEHLYPLRKGTSTPTKDGEAMNPDFSIMSAISSVSYLMSTRSVLQETVNMPNMLDDTIQKKRKSSSMEDVNDLIEKLDVKRAKKAGNFLDGCAVYLAGFGPEQREKLCKVLNCSGATRYDDLSERITHVIVGDLACPELKIIQSRGYQLPLVSVKWLTDSIEQQQPVMEENYLVSTAGSPANHQDSPLSKKGLQVLRNGSYTIEPASSQPSVANLPEPESETDIIQQYLKPGLSSQEDTLAAFLNNENFQTNTNRDTLVNNLPQIETLRPPEETAQENTCSVQASEEEETVEPNLIFEGLVFIVANFDEEEQSELKECIESLGGQIVSKSYKGIPDYAVVPVFSAELSSTVSEVITDYWITECARDGEIKEIAYYHRPFSVRETNPLDGCVITVSSYTGLERNFLIQLIQRLGAISQEQLSRVAKSDIKATTHLLTPEASGKKYMAAIKWFIPVVDKDWLLECIRTGSFVSEKNYLIGDSKAPDRPEKEVVKPEQNQMSAGNVSGPSCSKEASLSSNASDGSGLKSDGDKNKNTSTADAKTFDQGASTSTPTVSNYFPTGNKPVYTPLNRIKAGQNSPVCSQVTPVKEIMQEVRMHHMFGTPPVTPKINKELDDVDTPDTPYGAFIRANPSPHLRKEMLKWLNKIPDHKPRRDSTPFSELKRRLWNKICPPKDGEEENKFVQPEFSDSGDSLDAEVFTPNKPSSETQEHDIVNNKLQQLQEMLTSSGGIRRSVKKRESTIPIEAAATEFTDSQPCTVSWDYMETDNAQEVPTQSNKVFMISGVDTDEREQMVTQLKNLGANVSDLTNYDPASTHLISGKPSRNEKLLSSMAAGKWILHTAYVERSVVEGRLLNEEEFEYGNPKSYENIKIQFDKETEHRISAMYWWRKEITRRGYGAFHDMRAVVIATKREPIVRVIEAGGGMVVNVSPPFDDTVYATHCLLEPKTVADMSVYVPLAKQGIYCVNTLYINNFLHRNVKDIRDCVLAYFSKYYEQE